MNYRPAAGTAVLRKSPDKREVRGSTPLRPIGKYSPRNAFRGAGIYFVLSGVPARFAAGTGTRSDHDERENPVIG